MNYSEDHIVKRVGRTTATFYEQREQFFLVAKGSLKFPYKPRLHFGPGSNRGTVYNELPLVDLDEDRNKVSLSEKKKILNLNFDPEPLTKKAKTDNLHTVFPNDVHPSIVAEWAAGFCWGAVVDFYCSKSTATVCCELGIPYTGFCLTEEHRKWLADCLDQHYLGLMSQPGPFFRKAFAGSVEEIRKGEAGSPPAAPPPAQPLEEQQNQEVEPDADGVFEEGAEEEEPETDPIVEEVAPQAKAKTRATKAKAAPSTKAEAKTAAKAKAKTAAKAKAKTAAKAKTKTKAKATA
jgi:hypothetical protein